MARKNNNAPVPADGGKRRYHIAFRPLCMPGALVRPITDNTGTRDYLLMPIDSIGFAWDDKNELFLNLLAVERDDFVDTYALMPERTKLDIQTRPKEVLDNKFLVGSMHHYKPRVYGFSYKGWQLKSFKARHTLSAPPQQNNDNSQDGQ